MVKAVLLLLIPLVLAPGALAAAPPALPAPALYADAVAQEEAVRQALPEPDAARTLLKAVRSVVTQYEALVRHYPTSGYADDALWRAAQLSRDAYKKFGESRDGAAAVRLLKRVAAEYPTSRFAKRAPDVLATLDVHETEGTHNDSPRPPEPTHPIETARTADSAPRQPEQPSAAPPAAPRRTPVADRPAAAAVPTAPLATLTRIRRAVLSDVVRITIDVDAEVSFRQEQLDGPPRIFFDFAATHPAPDLADRTLRFDGDADIIRQIRVGRRPNAATRVVFDTAGSSDCSASPLYTPYRLVVDCVRQTAQAPAATESAAVQFAVTEHAAAPPPDSPVPAARLVASVPPAVARPLAKAPAVTIPPAMGAPRGIAAPAVPPRLRARAVADRWTAVLPSVRHSIDSASLVPELLEPFAAAPVVPPAASRPLVVRPAPPPPTLPSTASAGAILSPPPSAPARNLAGGFSIARQLGLGVSRIVIDPGHGGHDPGAKGGGATEAALVLDIALRLEQLLTQTPGVEVVLTRRTDQFVTLEERTAIANREGADLFLSIHANASASAQVGGVETYFLDFATSTRAASVAARENATSGQAMNALPDFVKAIALNNKLDESRDFATYVQRAMMLKLRGGNTAVRDLGVKQAPFVVLIGASMPSVLAEVSFLTNEQEAKLLKGESYRQRIADALCQGIQKYQGSLNRAGKVAQQ